MPHPHTSTHKQLIHNHLATSTHLHYYRFETRLQHIATELKDILIRMEDICEKYELMRRLAYLACLIASTFIWSCTPTDIVEEQETPSIVDEQDTIELKRPKLTVDEDSLSIDMGSELLAMVFNWDNAGTEMIFPTYELVIADAKDTELKKAESFVCNSIRKALSHIEIDEMVRGWGYSINEKVTLKAFVHVSAKGFEPVSSDTLTLKVQVKIPSIYPIGSATPYGWDTRLSVPMKRSGDIFTCDLALAANQDLKFLIFNTSWWPGIVNSSSDPYIYKPWLHFTELDWELDKKFYVDKDGTYRLTVNTSDANNITFTAELL